MEALHLPYGIMVWVLWMPDPADPHRLVPYLHEGRGTVWFSEPQFADRFIREHPSLPSGIGSRAVLGGKRILALAAALEKAGVRLLYFDLEYGKAEMPESLSLFAGCVAAHLEVSGDPARSNRRPVRGALSKVPDSR